MSVNHGAYSFCLLYWKGCIEAKKCRCCPTDLILVSMNEIKLASRSVLSLIKYINLSRGTKASRWTIAERIQLKYSYNCDFIINLIMETRGTFSCLQYLACQTMGNVKITEFTASEICSPLHPNVIHELSFIMDAYIFCKLYNMPNMPALLAF